MAALKQNLRESFENSSGIIGQTLRAQREAQEKEQGIQQKLSSIEQTSGYIRMANKSLSAIEIHLLQTAKNFQAINKSMGVYAQVLTDYSKTAAKRVSIVEDKIEAGADRVSAEKIDQFNLPEPPTGKDSEFGIDDLFDLIEKRERKRPKSTKPTGKGPGKETGKPGEKPKPGAGGAKEAEKKAAEKAAAEAAKKAEEAAASAGKGKLKELVAKMVESKVAKLLGKAIPVVGLVLGVGFAVKKLFEGDYVGAGLEVGSGLAGPVTAIPLTIWETVREAYQAYYGEFPEYQPRLATTRLPELTTIVEEAFKEELARRATLPKNKYEVAGMSAEDAMFGASVLGEDYEPPPKKSEGGKKPAAAATPAKPPTPAPSAAPVAKAAPTASTGTGMKPGGGEGMKPGGGEGLKTPEALEANDASIMEFVKFNEAGKVDYSKINKPYKDSLGLWSLGIGHLIGDGKTLPKEWDREFSKEEIDALFVKDYLHHKALAMKGVGWKFANKEGQTALIDLAFNMGGYWYKKFPKAAGYLQQGDFAKAADELQDSLWFKQIKLRGPRTVAMMRVGGTGADMMASSASSSSMSQQSTVVAAAKMDAKNKPDKNIIIINEKKQEVREA
ncbi:hypothetical protein EBT25_11355 [bacterium]|nr:hypothetical protein [bacterium]